MSSPILRHAVRAALLAAASGTLHAQESATVQPAPALREAQPESMQTAADGVAPGDIVIVTGRAGAGTRTKSQASYSITTIDEDTLRMQAPTSVTEALKSVPGFWVEASGGEASGNIRARGIPVDGFGSVTLLEDGIPVQHDPSLGYLNADQAFRIDETIERIEVVRGGPSSVFYTNAPAGAVNFRSRMVGDKASGIVKVGLGNFGQRRVDFWAGMPLADGWKAGIGGFYRIDDGIRSPGYRANDGGQVRVRVTRALDGGNVSLDFKHLDDKVALFLGIPMRTYEDGHIGAIPGFDANRGTVAGPQTKIVDMRMGNGATYRFDNGEGTHVKRNQFTFAFDKKLGGGWKLTESLRHSSTDTQRNGVFPNQLLSTAAFLRQSQGLLSNVPGATRLALQRVDAPGTDYADPNGLLLVGGLRGVTMPLDETINDVRLSRQFALGAQTHDVTLGYYFARFTQGFDRYSSTVLLGAQSQAPLLDLVGTDAAGRVLGTVTDHGIYNYGYEWEHASGKSRTHALYLSDEWRIDDRLRIDGGVRWEKVNTRGWTERGANVNLGTFATSKIRTGTGVLDHYDNDFDKVGWTLGANWQLARTAGVFGRWTKAFRLPNLSSYITSPTAVPVIQTMDLGELGYKYSSAMVELYPTLFYSKYNNVSYTNKVFSIDNATSRPQTGYASSRTFGVELEGRLFPSSLFDLGFNVTLQDPEYRDLRYTDRVNNLPVQRDYSGNQLIRVPKVSARLVPGVNLLADRLRLQLAYEYQGKRFVDSANSVLLPKYHVLNFSARWQATKAVEAFLYVDNVENAEGLTEGNPRAGELASADAGANTFIARPLLGRTVRAAVKYAF